jgi:hypothetical protein
MERVMESNGRKLHQDPKPANVPGQVKPAPGDRGCPYRTRVQKVRTIFSKARQNVHLETTSQNTIDELNALDREMPRIPLWKIIAEKYRGGNTDTEGYDTEGWEEGSVDQQSELTDVTPSEASIGSISSSSTLGFS